LGSFAVIILDTHIWYWWVHTPERLTAAQLNIINAHQADFIGVSAISCWEVAKRVEGGRMQLSRPVDQWLDLALRFPGVQLVPLTPQISVASTQLPGTFHKDPADQIIVATARVYNCPLVTSDQKIIDYAHVISIV
jgi:PIN domain nuclease of toxin-antitoxin system